MTEEDRLKRLVEQFEAYTEFLEDRVHSLKAEVSVLRAWTDHLEETTDKEKR